jgi:orotate phosphoribosyltransferase
MNSKERERKIAEGLLEIQAVFLRPNEPFTWASGIKSPIYCDNRLILTAPEIRDMVESAIAETVDEMFPKRDKLMGTSTAGIAHAAIAAHLLGIPMGYVRASSKSHGRNNRIEGKLEKGDKVVVIEDLISTGGSSIEVVEALREAGAEVLGVISIFTYGTEKAEKAFSEAGVEKTSLCNINALIEVATGAGYVTEDEGKGIIEWLKEI